MEDSSAQAELAAGGQLSPGKLENRQRWEKLRSIKVFGGSSHPELVEKVVARLSIAEGQLRRNKFANQETQVELHESVRDEDVFIFQTGGLPAVNDHLMELLILSNACKVAAATRVVAVLPFMPYSKRCKKKTRTTVPAKLVANMMKTAGITQIITCDLHAEQIEGFFDLPVDNVDSTPLIRKYVHENVPDYRDCVVVSKNAGGVKRATALADSLAVNFAVIHKDPGKQLALVGDVAGRRVLIVDDLIDSSKPYIQAAQLCKQMGAVDAAVVVTHALMSGPTVAELEAAGAIDRIVCTNTIPQTKHLSLCTKLHVLDTSPIFAEAVRRVHNSESVSFLSRHVPASME